jgi:predicted thioredoxin/glutaredoxin
MFRIFYVPVVAFGGKIDTLGATSCGIYPTKQQAYGALFDSLVNQAYIFDYREFSEMVDRTTMIAQTKSKFMALEMSQKEALREICHKYGDSYFEEGWTFRMDQHVVQITE